MKIERVSIVVDDGCIDSVGGVHTNYSPLEYDDTTIFRIKATTDDANVLISLTSAELKRMHV